MNIRNSFGTSVLSAALLLASGIPALARNARTVALPHNALVSGTNLPAGRYSIRWEAQSPTATVQFLRGNKIVLSTAGKIEQRHKSYNRNEVVYDTASDGTMTISEIRFAGSKEALVFNQ